jgi:membrane protein DedA with SNARE-associated domain
MPWRQFAIFNFLGAVVWVTVISTAGYLFGRHWDLLLRYLKRLDVALVALALLVIFLLWRRRSKVMRPAPE